MNKRTQHNHNHDTAHGDAANWNKAAVKSFEIAAAVPQVIMHRMNQMAMAGPLPNEHDQREFHLMSQEKIDAIGETVAAMVKQSLHTQQEILVQSLTQLMSLWTTAVFTPTILPELLMRTNENMNRKMSSSHSFSEMANKGLEPVHRTVTANARRLSGRGK